MMDAPSAAISHLRICGHFLWRIFSTTLSISQLSGGMLDFPQHFFLFAANLLERMVPLVTYNTVQTARQKKSCAWRISYRRISSTRRPTAQSCRCRNTMCSKTWISRG